MPVADHAKYCEMLDRARKGKFAYPVINVTLLTTANAVLKGLAPSKSDGIIQVSTGGAAFASGTGVKDMFLGATSIAEHVHHVAERKSVVTDNKVHALLRLTLFMPINLVAAKQAVSEVLQRAIFATKETSYVIAKAAVPFLPTIPNKAAYLVKAGSVPSFGNYLCAGKRWIRLDIPKHGRIAHHLARGIACKDGCEIETETIHVRFFDPVTQTMHDHAANNRMIGVERISCSAVVGITPAIWFENVVRAVIDSTKAELLLRPTSFRRERQIAH
jgi:hypothetical protein